MTVRNNKLSDCRGFTLIEMVVVLAILAILVAVFVPSFTGYIHRLNLREIVQIAEANERTCLELAGLQYAEVGNPYISGPVTTRGSYYLPGRNAQWNGLTSAYVLNEATLGEQFIYSDGYSQSFTVADGPGAPGSINLMRFSVANSYANSERRTSAGLREYQSRMAQPLAPASFLTADQNYGTSGTRLWFERPGDDALARMNSETKPYYYRYDLVFSEYWFTLNGKNYGVFHNMRFDNTTESVGHDDTRNWVTITPGWFVYEYRGGTWYSFGAL
ncbi:MAG: type II secretion system GspH family protein [Coriobacteriales bacterium]|jgi:prepilin-type N-terminal cleavage/methylation domain-containing protein|nr:type II secretion system GspH family protein [Coriobacteriales bacterium]